MTADLRRVLSHGGAHTLLWDAETGKAIGPAGGWTGNFGGLLPDGKRFIAEVGGKLDLYDTENGNKLSAVADLHGQRTGFPPTARAFW